MRKKLETIEQAKIIDSAMTLEEALAGKEIPSDILETLRLVDVSYVSFDGSEHQGQLVVHESVAEEVQEIFAEIRERGFPIQHAVPVTSYGWSDESSMNANNTSAFNYRTIYGTDRLSLHAYGLAVDINPALNPYTSVDNEIFPEGAVYDPSKPGTLVEGDMVVELFESRGWEWGGRWKRKDWHHFQKNI